MTSLSIEIALLTFPMSYINSLLFQVFKNIKIFTIFKTKIFLLQIKMSENIRIEMEDISPKSANSHIDASLGISHPRFTDSSSVSYGEVSPSSPLTRHRLNKHQFIEQTINRRQNNRSFIQNSVRYASQGGRSKQNKDCSPIAHGVEHALNVLNRLDSDSDEVIDYDRPNPFIFSAKPNVSTLFSTADFKLHEDEMFSYDCHGSPFCGLTCIDIAVGRKPDVKTYREFLAKGDIPQRVVGSSEFLKVFASNRGVNLRIMVVNDFELVNDLLYINNPQFRLVILRCKIRDDLLDINNHYTLMCQEKSNPNNYSLPELTDFEEITDSHFGAFGWLETHKRVTVKIDKDVIVARNNDDTRVIYDRNEDISVQDSYKRVLVTREEFVVPTTKNLFVFMFLSLYVGLEVFLGSSWIGLSFSGLVKIVFVLMLLSLARSCRTISAHKKELLVSVVRSFNCYAELQMCLAMGLPHTTAIASISKQRSVNTNPGLANVLSDTATYMGLFVEKKECETRMTERYGAPVIYDRTNHINMSLANIGMVNYSINGRCSVISNINTIADNQEDYLRMKQDKCVVNGGGNGVDRFHFDNEYQRKPIAIAPLGTLLTDKGPVLAVLYPDSSPETVLVAFAGRSMNKPKRIRKPVDFINFSKKFVEDLMDRTVFHSSKEPREIDFFREHYSKIKSKLYVEQCLTKWEQFMLGKHNPKFTQHKCFVKFERSNKRVGNRMSIKPRLIMVMSDEMMIKCCPILQLIHEWNKGPFSKYQVKEMTPEEMVDKIISHSSQPHTATDYSSFESSIDDWIKEIELFALDLMCVRANFTNTNKWIKHFHGGPRKLHVKGGKFHISTRCSGDFWTSFGNGLVNVCVMAYSHYSIHGDLSGFSMVAEGDDGLIPTPSLNEGIIKDLGFEFSQNNSGFQPGDVDFLSSRWVDGKRLPNIGKVLSSLFWVKKAANLKKSKQLYLLRCMAGSAYHLFPNHPIITEAINRIGRLTSGISHFKGAEHYLDKWKFPLLQSKFPKDISVDETLRPYVAEGAHGFPRIPYSAQLELERVLREEPIMYIGQLLNDYEYVTDSVESILATDDSVLRESNEFVHLCAALGPVISNSNFSDRGPVTQST